MYRLDISIHVFVCEHWKSFKYICEILISSFRSDTKGFHDAMQLRGVALVASSPRYVSHVVPAIAECVPCTQWCRGLRSKEMSVVHTCVCVCECECSTVFVYCLWLPKDSSVVTAGMSRQHHCSSLFICVSKEMFAWLCSALVYKKDKAVAFIATTCCFPGSVWRQRLWLCKPSNKSLESSALAEGVL